MLLSQKTFSYTTNPSFLERVKSGNEKAWSEFYKKYAGMIYHIGQEQHLSPEECDDLTIEVMTVFWKKIDNFLYDPARGKFRSYLGKISNFTVLKIKKRRSKEIQNKAEEEEILSYPECIEDSCMKEWQDFIISKALEELRLQVDTETYQAFYMSFFQHRPPREIAAITRKSVNNVYVIRSRCLKKLKAIISCFRQCEEAELLANSSRNASDH